MFWWSIQVILFILGLPNIQLVAGQDGTLTCPSTWNHGTAVQLTCTVSKQRITNVCALQSNETLFEKDGNTTCKVGSTLYSTCLQANESHTSGERCWCQQNSTDYIFQYTFTADIAKHNGTWTCSKGCLNSIGLPLSMNITNCPNVRVQIAQGPSNNTSNDTQDEKDLRPLYALFGILPVGGLVAWTITRDKSGKIERVEESVWFIPSTDSQRFSLLDNLIEVKFEYLIKPDSKTVTFNLPQLQIKDLKEQKKGEKPPDADEMIAALTPVVLTLVNKTPDEMIAAPVVLTVVKTLGEAAEPHKTYEGNGGTEMFEVTHKETTEKLWRPSNSPIAVKYTKNKELPNVLILTTSQITLAPINPNQSESVFGALISITLNPGHQQKKFKQRKRKKKRTLPEPSISTRHYNNCVDPLVQDGNRDAKRRPRTPPLPPIAK